MTIGVKSPWSSPGFGLLFDIQRPCHPLISTLSPLAKIYHMDENECCYIQRCNKCTQPCNEIPHIREDKLNRWDTQTFKMELKHAWQPIIWSSRLSFRLEHIYDNCSNEGIFRSRKKQNGSTCICYVHKNLNVTNLITSDLNTIGLNSSKFLELLLKLGICCRQRQTSNINGVTLHCKRTG